MVKYLIIRHVACFLNLGFRTFLEEEGVVVVVDTVIAFDSYHLEFFLGKSLNGMFHVTTTLSEVFFLNHDRCSHRANDLTYSAFDVVDVVGIFLIIHIFLREFTSLKH